MSRRLRPALCYRSRTWELVQLGPEALPGWNAALERVRDLPHDAAGQPLDHLLASAYLQGLIDGQSVAAELARMNDQLKGQGPNR